MRKLIKWLAIGAGALATILVLLIILLPFILPLNTIKDFAALKISEALNREVSIEKVGFNLFSGIELKGLKISNRQGFSKIPFIAANEIELKYDLWPLFLGKINISKISLIKPEIFIEKNSSGEFNFADITQSKPATKEPPAQAEAKPSAKAPFMFFISSFSISKGKLIYADNSVSPKLEGGVKDFNLDIYGITLSTIKPMHVRATATGLYQGTPIPISLDSSISLRLPDNIEINSFNLSVAGENLSAKGKVSSFADGPIIDFSASSQKIKIESFLGILGAGAAASTEKKKAKPGELTASLNQSLKALPSSLQITGNISLANVLFKDLKLDKASAAITLKQKVLNIKINAIQEYKGNLSGGISADLNVPGIAYSINNLSLKGFDANPFWNSVVESFMVEVEKYQGLKNKLFGTLDFSLSAKGSGVEMPAILKNLSASGSIKLINGKLAKLEVLQSVGEKVNLDILKQDFMLDNLSSGLAVKNQVLTLSNFNAHNKDIKVVFSGAANLGSMAFVPGNTLGIKLEKSLAKGLGQEFELFMNPDGSAYFEFEMQGSLMKPIPSPKLQKAVNKAIDKVKEQIEQRLAPQQQKTKDEAKKQLEQGVKNLLKF